ncbi:MAG: hypothetical protein L0Y72_27345 [Gemmataceae bacterium]|nr:hypothetical protein [Gemmataceae bacterium]
MNTTIAPPATASAEPSLTRAEKEKLLLQMYHKEHWIELIRLFGYRTLPMEQARQAIKPLADKFGKEPMATACEVLVEISTPDKNPIARLKPHIRRMAFQILGPPPAEETPAAIGISAPVPKVPDAQPTEPKKKRKQPKQAASAPAHADNVPPATGRDAIMEQYRAAKEKHPGMLLLFRMGDFYELFNDDAETAHKLLGLTLTTRDRAVTMAGFPHHQLETYLHKLLREGQRVAICEPVEESLARGPIRREVTRVVTPAAEETPAAPTEPCETPKSPERPVRQPRHFVLKRCEGWFTETGLAFVAIDEVRRTTPAVVPYVGVLDFIVLRGEEKLLVTVRPRLQAKHLAAIRELKDLYGPEYKPVRIWPTEGPDGWIWQDHSIDVSTSEPAGVEQKPKPKRSSARKSR